MMIHMLQLVIMQKEENILILYTVIRKVNFLVVKKEPKTKKLKARVIILKKMVAMILQGAINAELKT